MATVDYPPHEHPRQGLLELLHIGGIVFVSLYGLLYALLDMPIAAGVEVLFVLSLTLTLAWLKWKGTGVENIVWLHVVGTPLFTFTITMSMGGAAESQGLMAWCLFSPLAAMMFLQRWVVVATTFFSFSLLVMASCVQFPVSWVSGPSGGWTRILAVINACGVWLVGLAALWFFLTRLREEQKRADDLLLNILPEEIALELKSRSERRPIARRHEHASVLFADIVGFTTMCADLEPEQVVEVLGEVFSLFDELAESYGVEKIKTIGDCYMVAAGVPQPDPDHACKLARMALDMRTSLVGRSFGGQKIQLRIGINSGPVVAGVIGQRKFIYDLWGEAVNLASRMEAYGEPRRIQITRSTYDLLQGRFECVHLGYKVLKGVGAVEIWRLEHELEQN